MSRSLRSNVTAAAVAVGLAALLSACGGESATQMVASAKAYLDKHDGRAALIQLRNAVQKDPKLAEARFLLGRTLLEAGDTKGAAGELETAAELGHAQPQVAPLLARTLLLQGDAKTVVARFEGRLTGDAAADAEVATTVAQAYALLGEREKALQRVDALLKSAPDLARAALLKARLLAQAGQHDEAIALVQQVTTRDPANVDAWHLQALFASQLQRDPAAAVEAWRKCLALRPDDVVAHAGIVTTALQGGELEQAKTQLKALQAVQPKHPQTRFLEIQLALAQRDIQGARAQAQQLLKQQPDNARLLELAGAVEYEAGAMSQANAYLNKALQKAPELVVARQLLARVYLRAGQPAQALTVLQPRLAGDHRDVQALSLAAEASLQSGDVEKAETYFERAAKAGGDDTRVLTSLAVARLTQGRSGAALDDLQRLAAKDEAGPAALALITERWRRNDLDGALKAIDALERKQPGKPFVAVLRGRVLLARHDVAGARASFERAVSLDPAFFPATGGLVAVDLLDKKPDDARKRLEAWLQREPRQQQALLALAELRSRTGASKDEVAGLLANAVKAAPADAEPRVLLVKQYLQSRDTPRALAAAQEAAAALPDNAEVLAVLATAQAAAGDPQKAAATLTTLAHLLPASPQPYLRLGELHLANHDPVAAAESLKHALEIAPNLLPAQVALIQASLAKQEREYALSIARLVRKQRPTETVGLQLEGEIQAASGNWPAAVEAFRTAQQKTPSADLAARLEQALVGAGKQDEAAQVAADWQRAHAQDAAALAPLAEAAMARRDFPTAEARYRAVLKLRPKDVTALNNIAWLMVQQKKAGAAALAQEADRLAPSQPAIMDTLALALADEGQLGAAVDVQKKAVTLAPNAPGLRLNLARLLIRAGDKALAKTELQTLSRLGDKFPAQAEVARLLQSV